MIFDFLFGNPEEENRKKQLYDLAKKRIQEFKGITGIEYQGNVDTILNPITMIFYDRTRKIIDDPLFHNILSPTYPGDKYYLNPEYFYQRSKQFRLSSEQNRIINTSFEDMFNYFYEQINRNKDNFSELKLIRKEWRKYLKFLTNLNLYSKSKTFLFNQIAISDIMSNTNVSLEFLGFIYSECTLEGYIKAFRKYLDKIAIIIKDYEDRKYREVHHRDVFYTGFFQHKNLEQWLDDLRSSQTARKSLNNNSSHAEFLILSCFLNDFIFYQIFVLGGFPPEKDDPSYIPCELKDFLYIDIYSTQQNLSDIFSEKTPINIYFLNKAFTIMISKTPITDRLEVELNNQEQWDSKNNISFQEKSGLKQSIFILAQREDIQVFKQDHDIYYDNQYIHHFPRSGIWSAKKSIKVYPIGRYHLSRGNVISFLKNIDPFKAMFLEISIPEIIQEKEYGKDNIFFS